MIFFDRKRFNHLLLKFIYSEKATNFCEISTADLSYNGQIYGADFAKFCGLLRIYELYMVHTYIEYIGILYISKV